MGLWEGRAGGGKNGELLLNSYRVFILDDGKVLQRDSGNGYTRL